MHSTRDQHRPDRQERDGRQDSYEGSHRPRERGANESHETRRDAGSAYFSRSSSDSRYSRMHQGNVRKRGITRGVFITLGVAAVSAVAGTAVWGVSFVNSVGSRMNQGVDDSTKTALASQQEQARARAASSLSESTTDLPANWEDTTPFYMLLLGTDKSESRTEGDEAYLYGDSDSYFRTDVMILTRVDPGNKIVTLVSIHRDTIVTIDGKEQKINAAYPLGGVSKCIEVVSDFAGVPISHFALVDIDGLAAITDAMGGVTVTVPYTIDDPYMGHLDAGTQTLNGDQALILCRSRHAFDYLGDGDRYRAAHQRLFLTAMATQLFQSSAQTMISVIDTIANYITTDLTVDQILSLAMTMRDMDTSTGIYSTMNPTTSEYINGGWYEISNDAEWQSMMAIVDAGEKPPVDSAYLDPTNDINSASDGSNATTITTAENLDYSE